MTTPAPDFVYTINETARRLGCSRTHAYKLIAVGLLRAVDISAPGSGRSKTRVRPDDLAAYIEQQTTEAVA